MRTRSLIRALTVVALTIGGMAAVPAAEAATSPLVLRATTAQVDRQGEISVQGTSACAAAVTQYFNGTVPANTTVFINLGWTATQRANTTQGLVYGQNGRAAPCFNNNPGLEFLPEFAAQLANCGTTAHPCPWVTSMFSDTVFYGSGFQPGRVHVTLDAGSLTEPTGFLMVNGDVEHLIPLGLIGTGASDVTAHWCDRGKGPFAGCDVR